MAKFCGKCGSELDETTGLCPNCNKEQLFTSNTAVDDEKTLQHSSDKGKNTEEVQVSAVEDNDYDAKPAESTESREAPLSKKEIKKQHKKDKKEAKKTKKREKRANWSTGKKIRRFFGKCVLILLLLAMVLGIGASVLVYFDIVDVPVISLIMDKTGIKSIPDVNSGRIQLEGKFTDIKVIDSDSAIAAAQEAAENCGLGSAGKELSVANINTVDGVTYYRLQQNYEGIPVYGRTFIVESDDLGNTQSLVTNGINIGEIDISKTIPLDDAKLIIRDYLKKTYKSDDISVFNNYTQTIYSFSNDLYSYSYKFYAMLSNELYEVFLDVNQRSVVACFSANMTQTVTGTGTDISGTKQSFDASKYSDTLYTMEDSGRNIRIYDADNRKVSIGDDFIYVVDSKNNTYKLNESKWTDKNGNTVTVEDDNGSLKQGDWKVIDSAGKVLDEHAYYVVDIYGQDTKLKPVESNSASFTNSDAVTLMIEAQKTYDFFLEKFGRRGFNNDNGSMSLVANNTKGAYSSGIAQYNPAAMLAFGTDNELSTELVAHEYMHSVERAISGMLYAGESGAIMEAYSDLFGEILEDYNDGNLDGSCDWVHHAGEEFGYKHSRSLSNPKDTDNPSKVGEETRPFWLRFLIEKNEVHHCSTIISHAAYIMTTNKGNGTPLNMSEMMKLWYRTLMTLPTNCTFSDLRESMILTANNMKFSAEKVSRVESAFSMAGIENSGQSGKYSTDIQISVVDKNGEPYSEYSVNIVGKKDLPLWFTEEYNANYDGDKDPLPIHLDKGDYTVLVTDKIDSSKKYSKSITVHEKAEGNMLRFATDFGVTKEEGTKKGDFNLSDVPTDAVQYKGHYYYLYSGGIASSYDEAAQYCESKGGYLATLTSKEENDFVYSYITQQGCESAYFGLSDAERAGSWEWINGEPFSYSNWHSGEPNSENSNENYALLYYKFTDGTWNDGDFGGSTVDGGNAFICEWGDYSIEQHEVSGERNVVLTLDVSGSMSGTPLEETKKASSKFINTVLEQDASIGVVTYDDESYMASDFSTDKASLQSIVSGLYDGGGTNIEAGLRNAQSMLERTNAKKKIIVLMSDGEPNDGLVDEELIEYAAEIKKTGTIIYTIGFFESLSEKSYAQYLMEQIASDGCHYEVADADQLKFFFEDMADQINGQKYIYVRIACPVDVSVSYDGETLDSSEKNLNARTSFGTLTFEENSEKLEAGTDDRVKVLRLKEGTDYDLKIVGTGHGIMNYTIGFMDENGEYSDLRKFKNIKITRKTRIDTEASNSDSSILNIDEDGDGKYDIRLKAEANGYGEEITTSNWIIYVIIGAVAFVMLDIIAIVIYTKMKKRRGE